MLSEDVVRMSDGAGLFRRVWRPDDTPRGAVLLIHGLAEHSGRYGPVAEPLCRAGYAVVGFDLRGFGRSPGRRGHMRFDRTFQDIDELLDDPAGSGGPVFLFGHSLGGLIALAYALDRNPAVAGIVVSSPALHTAVRDQPAKVMVARVLGNLFPAVTLPSGLDDTRLFSNPDDLADFRNDPLVHDRMSAGFGMDCMTAMDTVLAQAHRIAQPLLLIHDEADEINFASGSREVAEKHAGDVTLRILHGMRHDYKCEPGWPEVADDIVSWLDARNPPGG